MQQIIKTLRPLSVQWLAQLFPPSATLYSVATAQSLILSYFEACFRNITSPWNYQIKATTIKFPYFTFSTKPQFKISIFSCLIIFYFFFSSTSVKHWISIHLQVKVWIKIIQLDKGVMNIWLDIRLSSH